MTCAEIREHFSARLDDALSEAEHELLAEHLDSCPECRREWGRFAATVGLLRTVEPVRAPAGFVDRVLAAQRPQPWYRRLTRGLLVPWPVKLPLEAAVLVLVAGLAVLIFQHSSELRQMASVSEPTTAYTPEPATASAPEPKTETAPASGPATAPPDSRVLSELNKRSGETVTGNKDTAAEAKVRKEKGDLAAPRAMDETARPASPPPGTRQEPADQTLFLRQYSKSAETPQRPAAKAPPIAATAPAPSSGERRGSRADNTAKEAERDEAQGKRLAGRVPANLELRLSVADRAAAEREVNAIVERLGGALVTGPASAMLEIMVPRDTLGALTSDLARLGTLRIVGQPADLPDSVRINLQLTD